MKNAEISNIFNNIADLLEIKGENPFRIRAYRKAAFNIDSLGKDVSLLSKEELLKIPGIGSDLAGKIVEYLETGIIEAYEKLKTEMPESLITLMGVPGLGPKTVSLIYKKFNIKDLNGLERLAKEHKLSSLPGIRDRTESNILKGIEMLKRESSRHPLGRVLPVANEIIMYLSANAPLNRISIAGSLRRWKDTIKDIDIISTSKSPDKVMDIFTHMPDVREILMKGPTKSSVIIKEGIQVDIRVVDEESFGSALAYFTGSKAHNIRLREIASREGLKINEYGIFREKDNKRLGGRSEEDIYKVLGLQYVPPELREDTGEIEAAASGSLPELIELEDIKGDLHVHSNWSDGNEDFGKLIESSIERGYKYIAITDHSKGLGIARGLDEKRITEQKRIIDSINKKTRGFRLLSGVEINIKSDGSLDFDDDLLRKLDMVVASIHSGFKQSKEQLTKRIVTAMKNPYVSVIAHPTGRLIGERDAYDVDIEEILKTASETDTAVEINAYPMRLDLSDPYIKIAKSRKVAFVISTDAHTSSQLDYMNYGVSMAKRGWLEKRDVLNTMDSVRLLKRLKNKTSRL
ncbi:MAG: DNA polymerase/3'-5' exonuclease PolX [Nitrospirota bacterium]